MSRLPVVLRALVLGPSACKFMFFMYWYEKLGRDIFFDELLTLFPFYVKGWIIRFIFDANE